MCCRSFARLSCILLRRVFFLVFFVLERQGLEQLHCVYIDAGEASECVIQVERQVRVQYFLGLASRWHCLLDLLAWRVERLMIMDNGVPVKCLVCRRCRSLRLLRREGRQLAAVFSFEEAFQT